MIKIETSIMVVGSEGRALSWHRMVNGRNLSMCYTHIEWALSFIPAGKGGGWWHGTSIRAGQVS